MSVSYQNFQRKTIILLLSNYLLLLLSLVAENVSPTAANLQKQNIIVLLFPDGSGNNYELKSLYDHSLISNPNYSYHVVLHRADYKIWNEKMEQFDNSAFHFYPFGEQDTLEPLQKKEGKSFYKDVLGPRMETYIKDFMESEVISKLKNLHIKFDLLETDIPSFLSVIVKDTFSINKVIYVSHRPLPQLFFKTFELNPSYYPYIGSQNGQVLTFTQRCMNFFFYIREKIYFWLNQRKNIQQLESYGYKTDNLNDMYIYNSLSLIQYPEGITFPLSMPPNMILLNSFNIYDYQSEGAPLKERQYIYVTKDIYEKNIEVFKSKSQFVFITDIRALYNKNNKNIKCSIVSSDMGEISASLFNGIPVIVYGNGMMEKNVQSFIKEHKLGDVINNNINLYESIVQKKLSDSIYQKNVSKISKILRGNKDARERYTHWLNYGFKHGFDTLVVGLYEKGNWFNISGMDVFGFIMGIIILVIFLIYYCVSMFLRTCTRKKGNKVKKE